MIEFAVTVWLWSQFAIAAAYLLIPYELFHWARAVDLRGVKWVVLMFVLFIAWCGAHHVYMPLLGHLDHMAMLAPRQIYTQAALDAGLAAVSVATKVILWHVRPSIILVLQIVQRDILRPDSEWNQED